jgi:FixJ family two-component response regulator
LTEKTILLVDDEPEILEALKRTLRDRGYRFIDATSGEDALLRVAETPSLDLVITDIDMPGMSGIDLAKSLRQSHPQVPRIILTGVASLESAIQAINQGEVHRFLQKPWDATELRDAVSAGLDRAVPPPLRDSLATELSPRLRQTLDQLLTGAGEKEIAATLGISPHTAHTYVKALYRRVGARSRAHFMSLFHIVTERQ